MLGELPTIIHDYEFLSVLGHGGFSFVYLVRHKIYQRDFAAKVTPSDTDSDRGRKTVYDTEIKQLTGLNHPNIIRIYDYFTDKGRSFIIIEYCAKGSAQSDVSANGKFSREKTVNCMRQIASALLYCHERRIAHLDIKAGNILFDDSGKPKLADFGISVRVQGGDLNVAYNGSPQYQAPEIYMRQAHDPFKADIWSFGVLLFYVFTGKSPWNCETFEDLRKVVCLARFRIPHNTDPEFADLIKRILVVDPTERISFIEILQHPFMLPTVTSVPRVPIKAHAIMPSGPLRTKHLADLNLTESTTYLDVPKDVNRSGTLVSLSILHHPSIPSVLSRYHPS